jgi:sec-independent protein translocase protein TatA
MFGNIGGWEILIIILLILIFFGAKKILELAQGLGKGIKEFRKAAKDIQEDISLDEKKLDEKK